MECGQNDVFTYLLDTLQGLGFATDFDLLGYSEGAFEAALLTAYDAGAKLIVQLCGSGAIPLTETLNSNVDLTAAQTEFSDLYRASMVQIAGRIREGQRGGRQARGRG